MTFGTSSMSVSLPFENPNKSLKSRSRPDILADFNYCCAYCGRQAKTLTLDHVHAKSKGGSDAFCNLVPACRRCNREKGSRSLHDWYTRDRSYYCPIRQQAILDRQANRKDRSLDRLNPRSPSTRGADPEGDMCNTIFSRLVDLPRSKV